MKCIKCWVSIKKDSHCLECFKRAEESWDIQHIVNKDTPQHIRKRFAIWNIRSNTIRCKECDTKIRSKNKQNHESCKCWWCSVDLRSNY